MNAPVAKQIPFEWQRPTGAVSDPWAWLRNREDPDTIAYLEAENRYADEFFATHSTFVETVFEEIKSRVLETDHLAKRPLTACCSTKTSRPRDTSSSRSERSR